MKDDYLWDRSGEPDPDVARLEAVLEPLRHERKALDASRLPLQAPGSNARAIRRGALAMAAGLVLVAAAGGWLAWSRLAPAGSQRPWVVTSAPVGEAPQARAEQRVGRGEWIETGPAAGLRLTADEVGLVDVGPSTRLRVVETTPGEQRLALVRGSLHAFIWAPPGRFAVETASATALDLGCSYTLEVDGEGSGRLIVVSGWVGLASRGVESLVPAGARCALRAGRGPGTPHFDDAPQAFAEALSRLDAGGSRSGEAWRALDDALAAARPHDAFTLWHLLHRLDRDGAARVYDALVTLAPPPAGVSRERVLAGDRAALESWWDSLGLGSSSLFRILEASSLDPGGSR